MSQSGAGGGNTNAVQTSSAPTPVNNVINASNRTDRGSGSIGIGSSTNVPVVQNNRAAMDSGVRRRRQGVIFGVNGYLDISYYFLILFFQLTS